MLLGSAAAQEVRQQSRAQRAMNAVLPWAEHDGCSIIHLLTPIHPSPNPTHSPTCHASGSQAWVPARCLQPKTFVSTSPYNFNLTSTSEQSGSVRTGLLTGWCVVQIMVPGKTNVSLTLSWSADYDPVATAQQPGAARQGPKGDADSEVMLLLPAAFARWHQQMLISK